MPLHRRIPKRGFNNAFRIDYDVVNLDMLDLRFAAGTLVTPESLRDVGLVGRSGAPVKILGRGELSKALTVRVHRFSGRAAEKIAAAGGVAETL